MTQNEEKVVPEQLDEQQQQAILEKFDRESVTRSPSNKSVAWFIAAIAIFYSLFHLFITFNPLPELIQRSAHVAIGLVLIFLLYPARIYAGEGVAQMLFFESDEVCETSYKDRGGKYQGQTGVTLPKT